MLRPLSPAFLRAASAFALLATLVTSCGGDDAAPTPTSDPATRPPVEPLALPEGCQPLLGGRDCFLPYPSDFFRLEDVSQPSRFRVAPTGAGRLLSDQGVSADLGEWMPMDGASKTPTIVALLGGPISDQGLVKLLDPLERSATLDSPTLLIEADTGQLVPHFVDVDPREEDPAQRALVLSPLVGLKAATRYLAVVRRVRAPDGTLAATPEGFRRLRDRDNDLSLREQLARYEARIFDPIARLGVARDELQLAWDFTTGSDELTSRDLLRVRALTLDWIQKNPAAVTIDSIKEDGLSTHAWRIVRGKITVPLFLTSAEVGATLQRDASGQVTQNGETQVPFVAHLPASVRDRFAPARAIAYGHGFFGSRDEAIGTSALTMADSLGAMFVAIDWWGMSSDDLGDVLDKLVTQPSRTLTFTDRVHQAMASWAVVTAALRTSFASVDAFRRPATPGAPGTAQDAQGQSNAGQPAFDPAHVHFLGISQGHILGGTQAAFNPDLERIALNVGGASLTQMMFRANPFGGFLLILKGGMKSPLQQRKFTATMQPLFDRIDPGFWASRVLDAKLPGSPADRRVLLQIGLGDSQVPNLGSFLHARLLGLPQITPTPQPVFGLEQRPGPIDGSAFALYDLGVSTDFSSVANTPKVTPVHDTLRLRPDVLDQLDQFLRPDSRVIVSDKP